MNEKQGLHSVVEEHMDRVRQGVTDSFDFWLSQHDVQLHLYAYRAYYI